MQDKNAGRAAEEANSRRKVVSCTELQTLLRRIGRDVSLGGMRSEGGSEDEHEGA